MPRLKFDLVPIGPYRHGDTIDEHNAYILESAEEHGWTDRVAECRCGYHQPGMLTSCWDRDFCAKNVTKKLEHHYRDNHLRGLREKRAFPGPPHDGKGTGWCRWCGAEIINPKTKRRHAQRTWCADGGCFHLYNLHTNHFVQRKHLNARDGAGCKQCGGPWTEVDHFIPLGAAWEAFPDPVRRRWFFSPANLQLLCTGGGCHNAKTKDDIAFIKTCQQNGEEWAKAEVLRRLGEAGLLRARQNPRGP